jgi:alkanesulfonate monooxygenase SsuD/methylene tetrahydromethanopterin reductase-like flavin-dependent oxidoreductase (luciferase family)
MEEAKRQLRNRERLKECFPAFAARVDRIIRRLQDDGFRPRVQEAFRTVEDQLKAFERGTSKVRFGFHNMTTASGKPESLAVDLLDDNRPLSPTREYLLRLAAAAQAEELQTGIFFGLPQSLRKGLQDAIAALDFRSNVKFGFDPTHLEVKGISIPEARAGKRP